MRDYTGSRDLIWYSEEELQEKLAKYEDIIYNIYKAYDTCTPIYDIEDYIDDELFEKLFKRREEEWNAKNAEQKLEG